MSSQRHISRIAAMQAIFIYLQRKDEDLAKTIKYVVSELPVELKDSSFTEALSMGAIKNISETNKLIEEFSKDQSLEKIDDLTLSILYLGTYELCFAEEKQPIPVIINEAIELAKEYGKDSSAPLVNAILSQIANK